MKKYEDSKFTIMKDVIHEEYIDHRINSIYKGTVAGHYIENISMVVESKLHIRIKPYVLIGHELASIFDEYTGVVYSDGLDYEELCEELIKCILLAEDEDEAKFNIEKLYKEYI